MKDPARLPSDSISSLSFDQVQKIDQTALEFERKIKSGDRPSIEVLLESHPDELRTSLFQELLETEVEYQRRRGQDVDSDSYLSRFPAYEGIVRSVFDEPTLRGSGNLTTPMNFHAPAAFGPVDGYEIQSIIGRGGMGVVYEAIDQKLKRRVAIKTLAAGIEGVSEARERLLREAQAAAAIRHPNVVTIYSVEVHGEKPFLVLELVEGNSLSDHLKETQQLSIEEAVRIAQEVAEGLSAAHELGIVHRDVKPGNILIESVDGRARLTDFGLAHAAGNAGMTQSGEVVGTPQYMSPEQVEGRKVDHRSDLFSLGAVLYRLLTGQQAFEGNSAIQLARRICDHDPLPVSQFRKDVPRWLQQLVHRLMEKEPDRRVQSAAELARLLTEGSEAQPADSRANVVRTIVAAVMAMAALIAVCMKFTADGPQDALDAGTNWDDQASSLHDVAKSASGTGTSDVSSQPSTAGSVEVAEPTVPEQYSPDAANWLTDSGRTYGGTNAGGVATADMNGDGFLDIVVASGTFRSPQPNQLLINDGHGDFRRSPQQIGNRIAAGVCIGDVDNDGDNDVFFANWSENRDETARDSLWFNDGAGNLTESSQRFDVGSARDVDFGDVNGDGLLDIWVANYNEQDTLWLNEGNGDFSRSEQELPGQRTSTINLLDMNGDQLLDAVVSGQGRHSVSVWLNDGTGRFTEAYWIETSVEDFAVPGDLNSDGFPDVVVSSQKSIEIYLNTGNDSFHRRTVLWPERPARKVFLTDLDGDRSLDLIFGTKSLDAVFVGLNDGQGQFDHRSGSLHVQGLTSLASGDFDQDGDTDIYFATGHKNYPVREDQLWLNSLSDSTSPATQSNRSELTHPLLVDSGFRLGRSASNDVAVADMDNDGDLDFVVSNGKFQTPQPNQLWINDGHGEFEQSPVRFGDRISGGVALGDVDGDGLIDIYFANWSDTKAEWGVNSLWLNKGNGEFIETDEARDPGNSRKATMADVDVDGDLDIWVSNFREFDSIWKNDGQGHFTQVEVRIPGEQGARAILTDIDDDGFPDAILGRSHFSVWPNHGDARFYQSAVLGEGRSVFFDTADVDSDGRTDIVAQKSQALETWLNSGSGNFILGSEVPAVSLYAPIALGDLDGDSDPDLVVASSSSDATTIYLNDGTGTFTPLPHSLDVGNVAHVRLADLDQDGDLDAIFARSTNEHTAEPDQIWWNLTIDNAPD